MTFRDRAAMVTGASRGLGAAIAKRLGRAGSRVALVARSRPELESVAEAIRRDGGEAHVFVADLGDKEAIHALSGAAAAVVGPLDLLVHNASELGPTPLRALLDTECEDLTRVLEVNLVGPFRLSRAVAGSMALRGEGTIVHVSSNAAVNAYPTWGAYSVSKAALDHLSRLFAAELARDGVRVLSIDPGEMDTAMHRAAMPDADASTLAPPDVVAARVLEIVQDLRVPSGARATVALEAAPGTGAS